MFFSLLFSLLSFFIFLLFEIILRQINLRKTLSPINILIFALLFYFIISITFNIFVFYNPIERYLISLLYFLLYAVLYLHLFIGLSKSVSLRIIDEINYSSLKQLSLFELNKLYSEDDFFYKRVDLMIENNWLINNKNHLVCSSKGTLLVKLNIFFLDLYKIKNSG